MYACLVRFSHQSASHAPVATSQTFPTFSQPSAAASLPARVHHRNDNTEYVHPPKRTDRGPRRSIEVRICHTHRVACLECLVDENYLSSSDTIVAKHAAHFTTMAVGSSITLLHLSRYTFLTL